MIRFSRFDVMGNLFVSLLLLCLSGDSSVLAEEIKLIGRTQFAATATDLSGQDEPQENGTPQNRLGGLGSGIAWLGKGNRYVMLPDRGPDDGAVSYRCRIQIVEIVVDPAASEPVTAKLIETVMLTNANGENYLGRASYFDRENQELGLRFDPEGVRVTPRGTFLISEEYGPYVREFDLKGKWIRDLPVPARYRIASPSANPKEELPPFNTSGRQNNRGWEGIGLSVDAQKVYSITQSPLIQDGGLDEMNVRVGTNIRIWEYDLKTGKSREFLYPLDDGTLGVSDIEAIAPNRLLVIERDSKFADDAQMKMIYEIDLKDATDISAIDRLPTKGIPDGVKSVAKKPFIDLLAEKHGLRGKEFPEKIEGIALGPKLADGSRVLIVTSDNDFKADQPTNIYAFSIK